jgi:hypothetical protein
MCPCCEDDEEEKKFFFEFYFLLLIADGRGKLYSELLSLSIDTKSSCELTQLLMSDYLYLSLYSNKHATLLLLAIMSTHFISNLIQFFFILHECSKSSHIVNCWWEQENSNNNRKSPSTDAGKKNCLYSTRVLYKIYNLPAIYWA